MTNKLRKVTALMVSFMLVFVSVFGSGSFVYAGGVEDGVFGSGKEIASGELNIDTERVNEYYPASFKYAVQNMDFNVSFADGTAETVSHWFANNGGYDGTDYAFTAYGDSSHDQYFMRFYRVNAGVSTQMKICDSEVPIGTFTVFITRNEETNPIEVVSIKINDPKERQQDANGTTASFSTNDTWIYEETWYPLNNLTPGKQYVFNVKDWTESNGSFFAGIWYRDDIDKAVYNLDVGFQNGTIGSNFTYEAIANETPYLVVGEVFQSGDQSGTLSWTEKRVLKSIELKPATSYHPWKHDIETMPLKLTYADGTTATEGNWMQESFDATGNYDYVEGYAMTTTNGDTIYMAKYDGGTWQIADRYVSFTPGSFNWRAFVADNQNIRDDATVKIADPSPATLKLEDGYYADFSVSGTKSVAYVYTPSKEERLQVINNGQKDIVAYTYFQPEGTNMWQYQQGELVRTDRPATIQLQAGWKYMTILSSEEGSTSGSIGVYSVCSTKSATVPKTTIQQDDYGAWAKLPIIFNFANPEGKSVGSQTLSNWNGYSGYKSTGAGETRYGEAVFYRVYKDGKLVEVPLISEEMLAVLADQTDDEVKNMILLECGFNGGVKGLKLATGTYTVKVYLDRVTDASVIGTGTVTVAKPAAALKVKSVKLAKTAVIYNGKAQKPKVIAKDNKGNTIKAANYTVTYKNNKKVGKATVTVKFKGKYSGTKTLTFKINPKAPVIKTPKAAKKAITVKWNKVAKEVTGYEVVVATNRKFTQNKKTATIKNAKTVSKKMTKLKAKKKYYVRVRAYKMVKGVKYYSAWSKVKTIKTK